MAPEYFVFHLLQVQVLQFPVVVWGEEVEVLRQRWKSGRPYGSFYRFHIDTYVYLCTQRSHKSAIDHQDTLRGLTSLPGSGDCLRCVWDLERFKLKRFCLSRFFVELLERITHCIVRSKADSQHHPIISEVGMLFSSSAVLEYFMSSDARSFQKKKMKQTSNFVFETFFPAQFVLQALIKRFQLSRDPRTA